MLLRYFVARYGYSTSIMAWELFNEVQFVDRIREKNDWDTVGKWHDEMAKYVRSIDTNHHLITTSSELDKPIWNQTDYYQGHGYPASVAGMLAGTPNPTKGKSWNASQLQARSNSRKSRITWNAGAGSRATLLTAGSRWYAGPTCSAPTATCIPRS